MPEIWSSPRADERNVGGIGPQRLSASLRVSPPVLESYASTSIPMTPCATRRDQIAVRRVLYPLIDLTRRWPASVMPGVALRRRRFCTWWYRQDAGPPCFHVDPHPAPINEVTLMLPSSRIGEARLNAVRCIGGVALSWRAQDLVRCHRRSPPRRGRSGTSSRNLGDLSRT